MAKNKKITSKPEQLVIPVETMGNRIVAPSNDIETSFAQKVEACGLNMPLLLQEILHELMLLRQDIAR